MRRVARPVAVLAALAGLGASGCGAGHPATRVQVITRADAICAGALADARALTPPTSTGPSGLAPYLHGLVAVQGREASALGRLPQPAMDRATLRRFVIAVASADAALRRAATAAEGGDAAGVRTALTELDAIDVAGPARAYGARVCAGDGATIR